MTRRLITIAGIVALLAAAPGLVPTAAADHEQWVFGAGVRVGGFELNIGYVPTGYGPPTYYYATHDAIHYDGYRCTDRCYRRGRTYYHHESCPVLLHLFNLQRVHPHRLFTRYAPRYDGRWQRYDPYGWDHGYRGDHGYRDRGYRHEGSYRREGRYRHEGRYRREGRYDRRDWRQRRHDYDRDHHGHDRHDRGRHDRGRHEGHGHRRH